MRAACHDRASYDAAAFDERLADLHYRDVCSFAVGHNTSGDWAKPDEAGGVGQWPGISRLPPSHAEKRSRLPSAACAQVRAS